MKMVRAKRIGRPLPVAAAAVMISLAAIMSGCIKEDRDDCPPLEVLPGDFEEFMIVRAYDSVTGDDISISDRVVDGSLFIFDSNKRLIFYSKVDKSQLGKEKRIPLPARSRVAAGDKIYISAWGNIEDNLNVLGEYAYDEHISTPFLTLMPNTEYDDYWLCPTELFFGLHEVVLGQPNDPTARAGEKIVHEVRITQINSRLMITVQGLDDPDISNHDEEDDYWFHLDNQNNGYTFEGKPTVDQNEYEIRETGTYNDRGEFISPEPFNLIPSIDPANVDQETGMGINLYRAAASRAPEDTQLIAEVSRINGNPDQEHIGLFPGQTTNVLIRMTGSGEIHTDIRITGWNEIHRWDLVDP